MPQRATVRKKGANFFQNIPRIPICQAGPVPRSTSNPRKYCLGAKTGFGGTRPAWQIGERGIFSLLFWVPFFIEIKRCPLWNIKFCHWRCFRQQTRMHVHWRSSKVSYHRCLVWFTTCLSLQYSLADGGGLARRLLLYRYKIGLNAPWSHFWYLPLIWNLHPLPEEFTSVSTPRLDTMLDRK